MANLGRNSTYDELVGVKRCTNNAAQSCANDEQVLHNTGSESAFTAPALAPQSFFTPSDIGRRCRMAVGDCLAKFVARFHVDASAYCIAANGFPVRIENADCTAHLFFPAQWRASTTQRNGLSRSSGRLHHQLLPIDLWHRHCHWPGSGFLCAPLDQPSALERRPHSSTPQRPSQSDRWLPDHLATSCDQTTTE